MIFVSIFYVPLKIAAISMFVFFAIYAFLCGGIKKPLKKLLYLMPYFVSVFILQAIAYRGEVYRVWIFNIDKKGVFLTLDYFGRFVSVIFFLAVVMDVSKKIKLPENSFGKEMLRVIIFFKLIRKYFFKEFNAIKNAKASVREKIEMIQSLIANIYSDVFKKYPFEEYVARFIKL